MKEEVLVIGKNEPLVGIITDPPSAESGHKLPVIIVLNAGILHRVGPSRLYVKMARDLAELGFIVLRLDFSGIGDSPVRKDNRHFEEKWLSEIQEVMSYLQETRNVNGFILTGICSGANISFKASLCDQRVLGAVLINPQSHLHDYSNETLNARINNLVASRHNLRIISSGSFVTKKFLKVIRGEVDFRSVARIMFFRLRSLFMRKTDVAPAETHFEYYLDLLKKRGVHVLHIYSEGDVGLDYLNLLLGKKMRELRANGQLRIEIIPGSNHTFTLISNQIHLIHTVRQWATEAFLSQESALVVKR